MKVGLLTIVQKNNLLGQQFAADSYFNPIEDANGNWIISLEEINASATDSGFAFLKDLPLIDYVPKQINI